MPRKVGILNGGGDCAGLNAVISAVVKSGIRDGFEFLGVMTSFEGLLDPVQVVELDLNKVKDIASLGGTILYSTNRGRFSAKVGSGHSNKVPEEVLDMAIENYNKLGLDALVVIGGDGTLSGALQLVDKGLNIVGVPKTIDNDLCATEQTFGFSTAVDIVTESLDRLHTTAASHNRVIIVETMGRNAGWIALHGGIAGNADIILIPEIEYTPEKVVSSIREQQDREDNNYSIILVAEGAKAKGEGQSIVAGGESKEHQLGGIADRLMEQVENIAPKEFEMRTVRLGHIQRGGSPNAEDRVLAQRYGAFAMELVLQEKFGYMPALNSGVIKAVEIRHACDNLNLISENSQLVKTARDIGISFAD
ncbi:MAG: 6-phosphofructokinase [Candidatus Dojkabacteria bacterium]